MIDPLPSKVTRSIPTPPLHSLYLNSLVSLVVVDSVTFLPVSAVPLQVGIITVYISGLPIDWQFFFLTSCTVDRDSNIDRLN